MLNNSVPPKKGESSKPDSLSVLSSNNSDSQKGKDLAQEIIDEMKNQGILDKFVDEKTGKPLFEIQFSNETVVCEVKEDNGKSQE
ncbi:hypothetical protein EZS27_016653 [termite gut metagenome]|uniref:Uncharacterized protein n=1 Tax=termite gut metagenome TaxID=433724 RepID=A0A5J4RNJ7_9ZZZZ